MIPGVVSSAGGLVTPTPTFSAVTATNTGFYFTITNYNSNYAYDLTATASATVTRSDAIVTVSGLGYSTSSTVTVTVSRPGWTTVSATKTGTSNDAPAPPPSCVPAGCTPSCGTAILDLSPYVRGGGPCKGSIICSGCPGCTYGDRRWALDCYYYNQQSCTDNCGITYYNTCASFCVDSTVSSSCCLSV